MNRRFRILAALLALVAFSAYFAEGILAAFCAPQSQHAAVATEAQHVGGGAHASHDPAAHDTAAHEAPADNTHQSHCPFGMAGGVTCVAASLPGQVVVVQPPPASNEGDFVPQQLSMRLLLAHSLYHPPRA